MIRRVQRAWFEVWGELESQNQVLKLLLAYFVLYSVVLSVVVTCLALRRPAVVTVSPGESRMATASAAPPEALLRGEVERVVRRYVGARQNWSWEGIEKALNDSTPFVAASYRETFGRENERMKQLAREKKLSQRFYFGDPVIDLKRKVARVEGDRILVIEGLRAVSPYLVEVSFDYAARSEQNPEGIVITAETRMEDGAARQPGGP